MQHKSDRILKVLSLITVAVILAGAVAWMPLERVSAATSSTGAAADGSWVDRRLERRYNSLLRSVDRLQERLDNAPELIAKAETLIEKAQAKGLDTGNVEAAVANYQQAATDAQGYVSSAQSALTAHAGFDGDGKVTDRQAAVETIKDASNAVREARYILNGAGRELLHAFHELRKQLDNE